MRISRCWLNKLVAAALLLSLGVSSGCSGVSTRVPTADEKRTYEHILSLSVLMLRSEQYGRAQAGFELLLEIDPLDPRGWDGLGSIALRRGELEAARNYLQKAISCDSNYDFAVAHFGLLEELEANNEQAEQMYRRALTINPLNKIARLGLGRVTNRSGELSEKYKLEIVQTFAK